MFQISLGTMHLTDNQILNWVPSGIWIRFHYIEKEVIAVSTIDPKPLDIDALRSELQDLPDTPKIEIKSAIDQLPASKVIEHLITAIKEKGITNINISDVEEKAQSELSGG